MATTVTPLPALDRQSPTFRQQVNLFFGTQLPDFTTQINQVATELMTARNETVAARNETVPLANQVITLAPQAIAASNNVSVLAPQVAQNAQLAETARVQAVAAAAQATQVNMGGSTGWPAFPPTQLNDWADSRFLRPVFTRTRASVATYIDQMGRLRTAASGEPVFEWDSTGRCRGLRIEPARTNLFTFSDDLTGSGWLLGPGGYFTASASSVPSRKEGVTARRFVASASATQGLFMRKSGLSLASATAYAASIDVYVPPQAGVNTWAIQVDLNDAEGGISPTFTTFGQWVRVPITMTTASARTIFDFNFVVNGSVSIAAGVEFSADLPQLEVGLSPSSYIPTTTAAVTRPSDVITLPAAAAAEVLNPAQGAFVIEFTMNAPSAASAVPLVYKNAAATEQVYIEARVDRISILVVAGGSNAGSVNLLPGGAVANTRYRIAFSYSSAGLRMSLNGGAVQALSPSTSLGLTWDRLEIGSLASGSFLNGHIASLLPYNRIPSDIELRSMSAL